MKNAVFLALTVLFSIGIGVLIVVIPYRERELALKNSLTRSQQSEQSLKKQIKTMQADQSASILKAKQKAQETTKAGLAYFQAKTTLLSPSKKQVDIYLNGNTSVDAVDLIMTYDATVTVVEVKKGNVFKSYPRLSAKDNTITVTGVAMPDGNSFAYGKTNELYATVIVETSATGAELAFDSIGSGAYFNGSPVLDATGNFESISL
jgi:hypothetical protein